MSKRYCITIILGSIIAYFLLVAFCLGESLHYGIADDPTVKGKGKDGECIDYALALLSRLAAEGIHGHLICYRWQICDTAIGGSHVFVVVCCQFVANTYNFCRSRRHLVCDPLLTTLQVNGKTTPAGRRFDSACRLQHRPPSSCVVR